MSDLAELLADCDARGIRLHPAGNGGLTIDAPQAALTPDMVARLKTHKAALLAILRLQPVADSSLATVAAAAIWEAALARLDGDPLITREMLAALRSADVRWAGDPGAARGAGGNRKKVLPLRFNGIAGRTDSRWAIGPAGLRRLREVPRIPDLVREDYFTK